MGYDDEPLLAAGTAGTTNYQLGLHQCLQNPKKIKNVRNANLDS